MQAEIATWHYLVALVLLAALGLVAHVMRAIINPYPDRLSDSEMLDLAVSDGYSWTDYLFGTEYDDAGYYRLDSLKNLRLCCLLTVASGMAALLLVDGAAASFAAVVNEWAAWLAENNRRRWNELF